MDAAITNYPDQRFSLRNGILVIRQHPRVSAARLLSVTPGLPGPGLSFQIPGAAPLQLPHSVRKHLEYRKSLVSKAAVREGYGPPRSKLLLDCGNRILLKGGRSPILGDAAFVASTM